MDEVARPRKRGRGDAARRRSRRIFNDVYAELPAHLRRAGQELFELGRRKGDAAAGDGEFPL